MLDSRLNCWEIGRVVQLIASMVNTLTWLPSWCASWWSSWFTGWLNIRLCSRLGTWDTDGLTVDQLTSGAN
jgi:hypothetical protein